LILSTSRSLACFSVSVVTKKQTNKQLNLFIHVIDKQLSVYCLTLPLYWVRNWAFLVTNATKNFELATRISQLVASGRLTTLFHTTIITQTIALIFGQIDQNKIQSRPPIGHFQLWTVQSFAAMFFQWFPIAHVLRAQGAYAFFRHEYLFRQCGVQRCFEIFP